MSSLGAVAQEATPTAPGASDCTVEPRTEAEILVIVAAATPTSVDTYEEEQAGVAASWEGVTVVGPADFATQQAVRATALQLVAYRNADLPLRGYALCTDELLLSQQVSAGDLDPASDEHDPTGDATLFDVLQIQLLSDGRVCAILVIDTVESPVRVEAFAFYFAEVDGRWLLDGAAV